jgi:RNA recognition motif. (a.k.a. RRM, RBD, or RNP domain)
VDLVMARKNEHEINHKLVDVKRAQARGIAPPSIHTGEELSQIQDNAAGGGGSSSYGGTAGADRSSAPSSTPLYAGGKTAEELGNKVFVGGIPPNVDRDELKQIFSQFGSVADAIVMLDQVTQRSRCFGFVTFENDGTNAAQKAINAQPLSVQGRNVEIKLAMPRAEQPKSQLMAQHQQQLLTSLPPGSRHVGLRAGQVSAAASNSEYAGLAVAYGREGWKAGYGSYAFGKNGWAVSGWEDYNEVKPPTGFSFALLDAATATVDDEPESKRTRY